MVLFDQATYDKLLSEAPNMVLSDRLRDCDLSAARCLVSSLPPLVKSQMGVELGEKKRRMCDSGRVNNEVVVGSRQEAAQCMQTILKRKVMVSTIKCKTGRLWSPGCWWR